MPLLIKQVTDSEFSNILHENRSTLEPDFQLMIERLVSERRVIVKGLNAPQLAHLRRLYPGQIHIIKYLDGHLIYLERD